MLGPLTHDDESWRGPRCAAFDPAREPQKMEHTR